MSKERLEELKGYLNSTFTDDNYEIVLCEDIGIPREQLKWLIRFAEDEAERVQELEEQLQGLHKMYDIRLAKSDEFEKQNKRYREALEYIAAGIPVHSPIDYENKARKALEGEE